jgi:hypothetical protein
MSKDELIKQLQDQVTLWRNKYEALAKLYSQLRTEHLDMLSKYKQMQLKANSATEAIDKMEKMERDVKAKNLELAGMIKERDRARFDVDRQKSVSCLICTSYIGSYLSSKHHKDEIDRLRRELDFANERAEDVSMSKSEQVSSMMAKYNRQLNELEDSLRVWNDGNIFLRLSDGYNRLSKFRLTISWPSWTIPLVTWNGFVRRRIRKFRSCKRAWIPLSNRSPICNRSVLPGYINRRWLIFLSRRKASPTKPRMPRSIL